MSSAFCLNLDQSKILSSGNGSTFTSGGAWQPEDDDAAPFPLPPPPPPPPHRPDYWRKERI